MNAFVSSRQQRVGETGVTVETTDLALVTGRLPTCDQFEEPKFSTMGAWSTYDTWKLSPKTYRMTSAIFHLYEI